MEPQQDKGDNAKAERLGGTRIGQSSSIGGANGSLTEIATQPAESEPESGIQSILEAAASAATEPRAAKRPAKRCLKPAAMPKRARSAYNYFFQEQRLVILKKRKQETKGAKERQSRAAMARAIAALWKAAKPEELTMFHELAAEDAKRHSREMKEYHEKVNMDPRESKESATIDEQRSSLDAGDFMTDAPDTRVAKMESDLEAPTDSSPSASLTLEGSALPESPERDSRPRSPSESPIFPQPTERNPQPANSSPERLSVLESQESYPESFERNPEPSYPPEQSTVHEPQEPLARNQLAGITQLLQAFQPNLFHQAFEEGAGLRMNQTQDAASFSPQASASASTAPNGGENSGIGLIEFSTPLIQQHQLPPPHPPAPGGQVQNPCLNIRGDQEFSLPLQPHTVYDGSSSAVAHSHNSNSSTGQPPLGSSFNSFLLQLMVALLHHQRNEPRTISYQPAVGATIGTSDLDPVRNFLLAEIQAQATASPSPLMSVAGSSSLTECLPWLIQQNQGQTHPPQPTGEQFHGYSGGQKSFIQSQPGRAFGENSSAAQMYPSGSALDSFLLQRLVALQNPPTNEARVVSLEPGVGPVIGTSYFDPVSNVLRVEEASMGTAGQVVQRQGHGLNASLNLVDGANLPNRALSGGERVETQDLLTRLISGDHGLGDLSSIFGQMQHGTPPRKSGQGGSSGNMGEK